MSLVTFDQLPDNTRLWVYAADRTLTDIETTQLDDSMALFMAKWTAHKRNLKTSWQIKYNQFLFVAVDESQIAASGCSVDSLVRHLKTAEQQLGCTLVGAATQVFFRDSNGDIQVKNRPDFKKMVTQSRLGAETPVFNNSITTLAELRAGKWEVPMRESWHWQAFGQAA